MSSYNNEVDTLLERYGMLRTITKERFPRKLDLSNDFVVAFREEFKRHIAPTITEDEDGVQTESPGRNKNTVLREMQKALKFLAKGV